MDALATAPPVLQGGDVTSKALASKDATPSPSDPATTPPAAPEKPETPGVVPDETLGAKDAMKQIADLEKKRSEVAQPRAPELKRPENPKEGLSMWGGMAIAFAALASAKTRTPMTNSLNAMAAAFQGVQQGNKEKFEQNYKMWEADYKLATETYQLQRDAYNDIMTRMDRSENRIEKLGDLEDRAQAAKFKALTMSFQDPIAWDTYQKSGMQGVVDLQKKRDADAKRLQEGTDLMKPGGLAGAYLKLEMATPEYQRADPQTKQQMLLKAYSDLPPEALRGLNPKGAMDAQGMPSQQTIDNAVDMIGSYKMSLQDYLKNFTTRGNARGTISNEVMAALKEKYPDWTPSNEHLVAKDRDNLNNGPVSRNITALGTLPKHIETLKKLVEKLPDDAGATALTRVFRAFENQVDPALAQYGVGAKAVSAEFAAALAGSGRPGITERAENLEDLTAARSKEMLIAQLNTMEELAGSRADELREQFKRVPDIDEFFPPELLKAYKREPKPDEQGTGAFEKISTEKDAGAAAPPTGAIEDKRHPGLFFTPDGKWFKKDGTPVE